MQRHWTPEEDATLTRMWLGGSYVWDIATALNLTMQYKDGGKRSVIGRANRLGLPRISKRESALRSKLANKATRDERWRAPPKPKPPRIKPADPQALIVGALLAQCAAAERRRDQYRAQPRGAFRAR